MSANLRFCPPLDRSHTGSFQVGVGETRRSSSCPGVISLPSSSMVRRVASDHLAHAIVAELRQLVQMLRQHRVDTSSRTVR